MLMISIHFINLTSSHSMYSLYCAPTRITDLTTSCSNQPETELRSPRAKLLWDKWRYVWMLAWERQRRLHDHLLYLQDLERVRQFSWEEWRKRFLKFMNHKKSRLTDLFRKMDKDNNGLIPREVFIDGIIGTSNNIILTS